MLFTVYILYSSPADTIYIGRTSHLLKRFYSHNEYGHDWTKKFRPWVVIYCEYYDNKAMAAKREKQLKSGKGREWIWGKIRSELSTLGFISA